MSKRTTRAERKVLGTIPDDAARVRQCLKKLGWSQSQLANEANLSLIMLNSFLNGKRKLSVAASERVLAAISVGFDQEKADAEARESVDHELTHAAIEKASKEIPLDEPLRNLRILKSLPNLSGPPRDPAAYRVWKEKQLNLLAAADELRAEREVNAALKESNASLQTRIAALHDLKPLYDELITLYKGQVERLRKQLLDAGITPTD